ncbi:MAG TPA: DUF1015 family protein [Solirubrobacteraceae bacterium]|jgi:uncharacterized protein (DUF1015 family)|nr:DUF1015 family protein [Solirubrobacteraceae bacterium]
MARVEPLAALHYDPAVAGPLQALAAPPYDVIDPAQRAQLAARSPYNVVAIDLPEDPDGGDPYAHAARVLDGWRADGAVVRDDEPALWALVQDYTAPDGRRLTRHGLFARVRVEDYGPGTIRPHERTHPGPKEDRLRLTRATRANLSPIFSLYSDPELRAWRALEPGTSAEPFGEVVDDDGTRNRLWRVADRDAIAAVRDALADVELLIADGHHRYETARVYAEEVGGEGPHRYVLMCLVALQDEGLTVFPTHRLVSGLRGTDKPEALATTLRAAFDLAPVPIDELVPPADGDGIQMGYLDSHFRRPFRLTLKDQAIADEALPGMPEPYRRLDTAVLEAIVLRGALGLSEDDISHLRGLGYARSFREARALVESGTFDAGFFLRGIPVAQIREIAAAGVTMPPKSTYFFPKVPTGLLFHPLSDAG